MTKKTETVSTPKLVAGVAPAEAFVRRIVEGPVLVAELQAQLFVANLVELARHEDFGKVAHQVAGQESDDEFWDNSDYMTERYRPYVVKEGVLTIPVMGSLVNRMSYQMGRYATGYEYIARAVERGMSDGNVNSIIFHIDSPGGQASGNFELVDMIASRRGEKPMLAMVQDYALSGGYSIATASDEIVVTRSGATGSVGVLVMHVDFSKALDDMGVKVTFIKAGEHKTDGNPFEPLSASAKKRIQEGVDKTYGIFVSTVANNRNMTDDAVRKTEALVYDAEESITVGFADRIGAYRTEFAAMTAPNTKGMSDMTTKPDAKTETKTETETVDATKVANDARIAERQRFAAVQASPEYKGREAMAGKLLSDTEMNAESIIAVLTTAPKPQEAAAPGTETPPKTTTRNHFAEAMNKEGTPGVGAEDAGADQGQNATPETVSATILSDYRAAGGRTVQRKTA